MRTSGQLRKTDQCEHNPKANISRNIPVVNLAVAQKRVIKRLLLGEPIDDIKGELAAYLDSKGHSFGTISEREAWLTLAEKRILRFVNYEMNTEGREIKTFPEDYNNGEGIVVDYFGEDIIAKPDYIITDDNYLYVCKIKTGRFSGGSELNTPEAYCLGLCGEEINKIDNTDKKVIIQYLYLADATAVSERASLVKSPNGGYMIPYDSADKRYNKIAEKEFNRAVKLEFKAQKEEEDKEPAGCSPEECAGCSMNNICHYVEPPIPAPVTEAVLPVSEVRLSNDQRNVINYDRGISRVNAGPGSGKTLVVSLRVAELVKKGNDPEKICLLTFTNAGAGEMTARSVAYSAAAGVPVDPEKFTSTTFNAFCQEIINANYDVLGYERKPRVIPDETKRSIINRILDQFPHISFWSYTNPSKIFNKSTSKVAYIRAMSEFEMIKREGYTRDDYPEAWNRSYTPDDLDNLFMMYDEFNKVLKEKNLIEFDDHIKLVQKLYEINPHLFEELGYEHIIVDEFQDTDLPQIELLQKMIDTPQFKSLMCVGDDSQSIFAFRHTSPEYMVNFDAYFGRFDDFSLVENHRSNRATIEYANKVNSLAEVKVDKDLIPTKPQGNIPKVQGFYTKKQEYEWIAKQVKTRWDNGERDIAVIMSNRFELTDVADALTKLGVPSTIKSPVLVTQNSRVCALTTFYDAYFGRSTQGFLDYRNILEGGALKGKSGSELEAVMTEFEESVRGVEKSRENFLAFAKALDENEIDECFQDFLEKIEECRDLDEICEFMEDFKVYGKDSTFKREGRYEGVNLTTIHSSKGLEWNCTFLCVDKLDEEKYHERGNRYKVNGEYDEQIRKWFVGATRAREELIITGDYICYERTDKSKGTTTRGYNDFLKESYEFVGKAWDYDPIERAEVIAKEKAEAEKDTKLIILGDNLPVIGDNSKAIPRIHREQTPVEKEDI